MDQTHQHREWTAAIERFLYRHGHAIYDMVNSFGLEFMAIQCEGNKFPANEYTRAVVEAEFEWLLGTKFFRVVLGPHELVAWRVGDRTSTDVAE